MTTTHRRVPAPVLAASCLAALGASSLVLERFLARRETEAGGGVPPIRNRVEVAASPEASWAVLADLEGQTRWMHDAKEIRVISPGPPGIGTVAEAYVRIFGLGTRDLVKVTAWDPPHRFAIRHLGLFAGDGEILLDRVPGREATDVRWDERLAAPLLPHLFARLARPVLGRVFRADLERFRALVEASVEGEEAAAAGFASAGRRPSR